ncbi:MAG: polysaccharide biosynthesis protein PslG [Solirubrobacteraceae bacterium]|jgi:hypothetical protein|nr:polysaccharide biosynthesis protein PslG [Solirubrobacteraceae bacterium]
MQTRTDIASMLRRLALAAFACALVAGALPAVSGAAQPGVVLFNPNLDAPTLQRIQSSGARHVRVFTSWRVFEDQRGRLEPNYLASFDDMANRLKAMGIGMYLVVTQTPAWASSSRAENAPPPPAAYADFMRRLAEHFRGRVMAYEVWNEPDGNVFWAGGASAADYTALLKPAYAAVKSADPAARVGVGGLVGNHYDYLGQMYDAGAKGSFDFVSVHTDTACSSTDPRQAARDVDGRISRWSFTGYREVRATMLAHDDPKPIWMTELGWQVTPHKCPVNVRDPGGVTAASQAAFLTHAYSCLAADPYLEMGSWFSLTDFGTTDATGAGYGLWSIGGAVRPALTAFQHAGSAGANHGCGLQMDGGAPGIEVASPTGATGVSADLTFKATATDDQGIRTLAILVDGKQIRITSAKVLQGTWRGWRSLPLGPHTVTFRAMDVGLKVTTKDITVNRVAYGDGEPVATRIGIGLYGSGASRVAAGRLYTVPRDAKPFLRGRMTIAFERQAGQRWVPLGGAAGGLASSNQALRRQQRFRPGRYRVVVAFAGYKSFRPAVARRIFTIR